MSIKSAGLKANMSSSVGSIYYQKYLEDRNHDIPIPYNRANRPPKRCTQAQICALIGYIENDKISKTAAAIRANISVDSGRKYYKQYLRDRVIPTATDKLPFYKPCTENQVKECIRFIINDNMTITAAANKANISRCTESKYYNKYLNDPSCFLTNQKYDPKHEIPYPWKPLTIKSSNKTR
ncbi:hypothetical protein K501DRAFT_266075 [Backusella circina FSU 941]|nr:hypothetical protein K501DRAFT_266075 [Backusella circina FSU 941]